MPLISKDVRIFAPGAEHLYRRLSVRECARIQTFPDSHEFVYGNVVNGYKMVGNAVPVEFARRIAEKISADLSGARRVKNVRSGSIQRFEDFKRGS
jgi:DNA (cytosine-5)-methyltransferase 1